MKKYLAVAALGALLVGNANAVCRFSWFHYGTDSVQARIAKDIESHITDEYCAKFAAQHQLVVQTNYYTFSNMVIGHSIVGIRKKGTKTLPSDRLSAVFHDTGGRTTGEAQATAVRATFDALDNLMSDLQSYRVES